ncbi:MAG: hypothetical protein KDA93_19625 [Planctomycetaceae bacterium]|nr:hypothetical protein [Planctomycetaceae bacterium]
MTDQTREELFDVLRELWQEMPDYRFGQMIVNLSYAAREPSNAAPWDVEDDELLAAARRQLASRKQSAATH